MRPSAPASRLDFLDVLRGLAILMVLFSHMVGSIDNVFDTAQSTYFELGKSGVYLFFLCSGFIIPVSLERYDSLRRFWIGRFFRLYPLYWVCIAAVIGLGMGNTNHPIALLANLSMAQIMLGQPLLWPIFWSLCIEFLFYVAVSFFFLTKILRHAVALAIGVMAAGVLIEGVFLYLGRPVPFDALSNLGLMFVGTTYYRVYSGKLDPRRAWIVTALAVALIVMTGSWYGLGKVTARLAAFVIFGAGLWFRDKELPRALSYLGKISYSMYLTHLFILALVPRTAYPALTVAVWFVCIVGLSTITYRAIEQPMIASGHKLAQRDALRANPRSRRFSRSAD